MCGKEFNTPYSLGGHISSHYGTHSRRIKPKPYITKCLYCNKNIEYYNKHKPKPKFCCIDCRKEYTKLKNENKLAIINNDVVNLTYRQIKDLKDKTNNCQICGKFIDNKNKCLDHDHNSKLVRGILCISCNRSLGWYENNKENILKYLNN